MKKITLIVLLPWLASCSISMPKFPDVSKIIPTSIPTLYKKDVNQGSILNRFKINQLKVGMSKTQVQNLIGSPSVIDPFHNHQWDYINYSTLHKKDDIHYRLTLTFKNNTLADINQEGLASLPALSDKEKILEDKRIARENAAAKVLAKAKIERIAREKVAVEEKAKAEAMVKAKAERVAQEKMTAKEKWYSAKEKPTTKVQGNKP